MVKRRRHKWLDSARVHELTFGCGRQPLTLTRALRHRFRAASLTHARTPTPTRSTAPPHVRVCRSRYDPATRYLQFECDVAFETVGFQLLFDVVARPLPRLPALRLPLALRSLSLRGRVLLGMSLTPPGGAAPGMTRIEGSFAEPPRFDVRLEALGLPLGDFPFVEGWARRSLSHLLQERFVEPRRASASATRMFARQTLAKRAGPGGTLVVVIVAASGLCASNAGGSGAEDGHANGHSGSGDALASLAEEIVLAGTGSGGGSGGGGGGAPSCFVELRYGGVVRRTHVAPQKRNPSWGTTLTFPVPAWAASAGAGVAPKGGGDADDDARAGSLCAAVVHWAAPGEPACVGEAAPVPIAPGPMRCDVGGALTTHRLRLRGGAVLHLRVGVLPPGAEEYALALAAEANAEKDAAVAASASAASVPSFSAAAGAAGGGDARDSDGGGGVRATAPGLQPQAQGHHHHSRSDPLRPSEWAGDDDAAAAAAGADADGGDAWAGFQRGVLAGPVSRAGSAGSLDRSAAGVSDGYYHTSHRPPPHPAAGAHGARGAALTHARSEASSAARDILTSIAFPAANGGGVGTKLPQITQAVSRLASAAVVGFQAATNDAAVAAEEDASFAASAGGPPSSSASYRSPPGHTRAVSGMDRILAAGARAMDAAVAAAGAPSCNGAGGGNGNGGGALRGGSMRGSPGHSRNVSWDDGTGMGGGFGGGAAAGRGHVRSGSADSALDAALGFGAHGFHPPPSHTALNGHGNGHGNGAAHHPPPPPAPSPQPRRAALNTAARLSDDLGGPVDPHTAGGGGGGGGGGGAYGGGSGNADLQRRLLDSQRRVRELESLLAEDAKLRAAEDVRALVEGARFLLHTPRGVKSRHVWYNAQRGRLCWAANAERRTDAAANVKHWLPLSLVDAVEAGTAHFGAFLRCDCCWSAAVLC
jgi:hypothetical protein